jgi:hypothetical protein
MSECRYQFEINRCEDPVPAVRAHCHIQEKCLLEDSNLVVKNINIFTALLVETLNQFSATISNRSIFVLAILSFLMFFLLKLNGQQRVHVTLDKK